MLSKLITRTIKGLLVGGCVGYSLGYGSLYNDSNNNKFNNYKEYQKLPLYGAKIGAIVGGTLYGFYPIVISYLAYKTGTKYELNITEIQKISQDLNVNTIYELLHDLKKI